MNTDPSTWPSPDEVDIIQASERFEESEEYAAAVLEWMVEDGPTFDYAAGRFYLTDRYDREFAKWMEGQTP